MQFTFGLPITNCVQKPTADKKVVQDDVKSHIFFFIRKNIHVAKGLSSDETFGWSDDRYRYSSVHAKDIQCA